MPQDQTVVNHLLLGRQAMQDDIARAEDDIASARAEIERLEGEQQRLNTAVEQLDSVIGMINNGTLPAPRERTPRAPARAEQRNVSAPARSVTSSPPAKRAPNRSRKPGEAPKSIRVHVLEMLAAEDRDWSLAEIIDRIHGAGIQAHDDAVRSITIKLMKDGRVERVGRGQYRLARRGSSRPTVAATPPVAEQPTVEAEPVSTPEVEAQPDASASPDASAEQSDELTSAEAQSVEPEPTETASTETAATAPESRSYTPPLNLGQPWN